jgi:hypothetical protein
VKHQVSEKEFVEVVPAASRADAERNFRHWLARSGFDRGDIAGDDIRVDVMRDLDGGTVYRYMVSRSVFDSGQRRGSGQ